MSMSLCSRFRNVTSPTLSLNLGHQMVAFLSSRAMSCSHASLPRRLPRRLLHPMLPAERARRGSRKRILSNRASFYALAWDQSVPPPRELPRRAFVLVAGHDIPAAAAPRPGTESPPVHSCFAGLGRSTSFAEDLEASCERFGTDGRRKRYGKGANLGGRRLMNKGEEMNGNWRV